MNTMALTIQRGDVIRGIFFYKLPGRKHGAKNIEYRMTNIEF
jgi:hypothetical protein